MGRVPARGGRLSAPTAFAYHRGVAPLMWVFVVLASVELVVVHFLLSLWSRHAALFLSIVTLASIAWLVVAIRSMRRLPVEIADDRVVMRVGRLARIDVPFDRIAGLRADWSTADVKARGVRNLALIAYPNVLIDLDPPIPARRTPIRAVAHRLDDPAGFAAALQGAIEKWKR